MESNSSDMNEPLDYGLHYRNWHDETKDHVNQMVAFCHSVLKQWLPSDLKGPALDIGCGMGFTLLALKQLGCTDCHGIDTDPGQIAACKRLGANAELVTSSITYLSDRTAKYQIITLFDVLEHVPVDQQVSCSEPSTLLWPQGAGY